MCRYIIYIVLYNLDMKVVVLGICVLALLLLGSSSSALSVSDCKTYGERRRNVGRTLWSGPTREGRVVCSGMELRRVLPPGDFPNTTVTLILSNNKIQELKNGSFLGLSSLERLDIRNNLISHIQPGAFAGLLALKRLDLSNNRLGCLHADMFADLPGLVRLNLSGNLFASFSPGAFDRLGSLKSVELQTPYLLCDCSMLWLLRWARERAVTMRDTRCSYPRLLRGRPLPSLQADRLTCDAPLELPSFQMIPSQRQIVFQGDSLPFRCLASYVDQDMSVLWFQDGKEVEASPTEGISIERTLGCSYISSVLTISNVQPDSTGSWECLVSTRRGNSTRAVHVMVLERSAEHCPPDMVTNNKGKFRWPWTLAGITAYLPCSRVSMSSGIGIYGSVPGEEIRAWRRCERDGIWAQGNYSSCQYLKDVTRVLFIINQMPLNLTNAGTIARQLLFYTEEATSFFDKMDIIFVAEMIEKFGKFAGMYKELGDVMVDIASNLMLADRELLRLAQQEGRACTRIVQCLQKIQGHQASRNIALEAHILRASSFDGMTCMLFQKVAPDRGASPELGGREADGILDRQLSFKCDVTSTNSSAALKNSMAEASIQLPASLLSQLPGSGPDDDVHRLQLLAFRNGWLFPSTGNSGNRTIVATPVILIQIDENEAALQSPMNVTLRRLGRGSNATAARWNASLTDGQGDWEPAGCRLLHADANFTTISCDQLGGYAVLMDLNGVRGFASDAASLHPVVYASASVLLLCLLVVLASYALHHKSVQVSRKSRHMLGNTCLHMFLTCAAFVGGVTQTHQPSVCQRVGIVLHFSSLATVFWLGVTARNIYKQVTCKAKSSEELHEPPAPAKPMLRFYLIGWGVPMAICGITASADMKNYGQQGGAAYCWMARELSLAAFYGPASVAALVACLYFLGTLVHMKRRPGRRYELKELAEERQHMAGDASQGAPPAASENQHSFGAQLLGTSLTLLLSALLWAAAALAVSQDNPLDLCFSCLFGVLALATGTLLLVHHCGYRGEVRRLWASACCSRRRGDSGQVMLSTANGCPPLVPNSNTRSFSTNGSASSTRNSSQECKLTNLQVEAVQHKPLPLPSNGTAALLDCSLTEHSLDNEIQMHVAPVESSCRVDWRSGRLQKCRTRAQRLGRLEALRGYAYDVPTSVDGSEQRGPCGSQQAHGGRFQSRSQGHLDSSDTGTPAPRRCRSMDRQWSNLGASIGASVPTVGTSLASSIGASMPSAGTSLASSIGASVPNVGTSLESSIGASVPNVGTSLASSIGASVPSVGTSLVSSIGASVPSVGTSLASSIGASVPSAGTSLAPSIGASVPSVGTSLASSIGASIPSVGTSLASSIGASVPSVGTSLASSIGASMPSVVVSMPSGEASSPSRASSCPGEGEAAGGFESNTNIDYIEQSMEEGGQSESHGPDLANQNGSVMDNGRDGLLLMADNPTDMKIVSWKHETTV
ncbi:LOW QUALITY PROTEIN: adhesion G protein-coupled receptor A3-like [Brienomyrus brachyistius]|uniref:LOW QUALITY PROTEIN: adhesion G protein-coupled receptor A3-like n=1 Tax=Brienomyrus brachyistius TaxID=42636 RepID=UPI0020B2F653|nr:LOW QUALITY PROTEIN: adhesion G protein-coupled receptor A3-like [Brienomyrus brachyistius]